MILPALAQDDEEVPYGRDRLVMQLNWNTWLNSPEGIKPEWHSRGINVFGMYDMPLGKSPFSIAIGAGIASDNVYHNGRFTANDTLTMLTPFPDSINVKRNKLSLTYLEAPFEFRFRTKPKGDNNMSFKMAVGFRGGLNVGSSIKYIGEGNVFGINQPEVKYKLHKVPNLDNLRYGLTFRVGYGPVNLHAYYGLNPIFERDRGPAITPFQIGLSFNAL
jgi:hypothetical protein